MTPIEIVPLPFGRLCAATTDLILDEVFVWVEVERKPTPAELRDFARKCRRVPRRANVYVNVDARSARNMRFAEFCGLREVRRVGHVSVQTFRGVV